MEDYELYHHGILGMKWGIRRYQNKDGTSTSAGKKHRRSMSEDASTAKDLKKKRLNEMSNTEIRKLTERQQLEKSYSQLNPNVVKKGLAIATATAAAMGTVTLLYNNTSNIVKLGQKALSHVDMDKLWAKHLGTY